MALINQIKLVYKNEHNIDHELITKEIYEDLLAHDADFFP